MLLASLHLCLAKLMLENHSGKVSGQLLAHTCLEIQEKRCKLPRLVENGELVSGLQLQITCGLVWASINQEIFWPEPSNGRSEDTVLNDTRGYPKSDMYAGGKHRRANLPPRTSKPTNIC